MVWPVFYSLGGVSWLSFDLWVRKIPWKRKWKPTPVFLPGKSHGQRSLVGYSPWGRRESDTTEQLNHHHHLLKAASTVPSASWASTARLPPVLLGHRSSCWERVKGSISHLPLILLRTDEGEHLSSPAEGHTHHEKAARAQLLTPALLKQHFPHACSPFFKGD